MNHDPRFALRIDEAEGQARLTFRAAEDLSLGEEDPLLLTLSLAELLGQAGAGATLARGLAPGGDPRLIVNGWQSWSWAGEVDPERPPRRSLLRRLALFTEGPAAAPARNEVLSYFYLGLRAGDEALFVVSRNAGGPPLAFRTTREASILRVEALARGASFRAGETVAELRVFAGAWTFGIKDQLRTCFSGFRHFDRLSFLGHGGDLVPGGYESWYNHYTKIDEALIRVDLEGLAEEGSLIHDYYLARGKPTVFQVDDGWEIAVGEWKADPDKFPSGMAALAADLEAAGQVPGLWLAPFLVTRSSRIFREHPEWLLRDGRGRRVLAGWNPNWDGDFWALDLSLPEVGDYLEALFDEVVEAWGYRYLKLDFLYAAFLPGKRAGGGAAYAHWERVIGRITSRTATRSGRPVAWLGCGAPLESSFRHFPLMRIGADTREAWEWPLLRLIGHEGRPAAYANLKATLGRAILDGTVFVNDPDVLFCREANNRLSLAEKEVVALVGLLLASQVMHSDGAAELRPASVRDFTARIIGMADRLQGAEFEALALGGDLFRLRSRDGRFRGILNLSDRPWRDPHGPAGGTPLLAHGAESGLCEARSISLYEV